MKTKTQEIFMTTTKLQQIWEQRLVSRGLAPLRDITVETQPEYILQPFRNSFDASELVEGAPINARDAVPSHDGYSTHSPMDTENILFRIFQSTEDKKVEDLALDALKNFMVSPKSVTTAVCNYDAQQSPLVKPASFLFTSFGEHMFDSILPFLIILSFFGWILSALSTGL